MNKTTQHNMRAITLDQFGGPEVLTVQTLPVPEVEPGEILIRVETAGVGEWDPFEREGGYAEVLGEALSFPYVLGSEGAGVVAALGERVDRFEEGDRVYAAGFLNPKGGFYAEFSAVNADLASHISDQLTTEQAGVMSGVAVTALRGLDDTLGVRPDESVAVVGASGGVGHVAIQLAKRMGARVLAIASGDDGVALVDQLGADASVDGRTNDVLTATRAFAPDGINAVLILTGGDVAAQVLSLVAANGRAAYPTGVQPEPVGRSGVEIRNFNGEPDREIIERLDRLIGSDPFEVHIARSFPLDQATEAHRALDEHYLGKLALRIA